MKYLFSLIFSQAFFQKVFLLLLVACIIYGFQGFLGLFLITFIFAYLSLEVGNWISDKIKNYSEKNNSNLAKFLHKYASVNVIVSILYIFFIAMIVFVVLSILPKIISEIEQFIKYIPQLSHQTQSLLEQLEQSTGLNIGAKNIANDIFEKFNFKEASENIIKYAKDTSGTLFKFLLGVIMSYIFVIDRKGIFEFLGRMKKGNFSFIYDEFKYIAEKITNSFGRVFKAQGIIAFVNAILTTIGLLIIGYLFTDGNFPYIFTLSIIVFVFGFIPVFGTFLSGLPIVIIGYGVGGFPIVLAIIFMISLIHAIEAYFLNPKIVSSYTHFPVFITFATLIIAEHTLGMIGLLVGVPLLSITISLFSDLNRYISDIKTQYNNTKNNCQCPTPSDSLK